MSPSPDPAPPARAARLADIASRVKLSRSGVSRALHNDPSIPLDTCRRVQRIAHELGFVADRNVSRAFEAVRRASSQRVNGTLALIDAFPGARRWRQQPRAYITRIFSGAAERAAELGYRLEIFSLTDPGMTPRRLQNILDARGVTGIVIPPLPDDVHTLPINWDRYTCIALTHSLRSPALHRVLPHQYQAAALALSQLQAKGYERIGFATGAELDTRVNNLFRAAYLSYQYTVPKQNRLPILMSNASLEEVLPAWLKRHRPDAVLGGEVQIVEQLMRHGRDDFAETGFVSLVGEYYRPGHRLHRKVAYIDQNIHHIGRAGIDQLVAQLERRERGIPIVANVLMIEGSWVPGVTVRSSPA